MCKILSLELRSASHLINVGDDANLFMIVASIQFKPLELDLKKEYCLNLYGYNVPEEMETEFFTTHGDMDVAVADIKSSKIELLGEKVISIKATEEKIKIETVMALTLDRFDREMLHTTRKLKILATITTDVGEEMKWSETITSEIIY